MIDVDETAKNRAGNSCSSRRVFTVGGSHAVRQTESVLAQNQSTVQRQQSHSPR